MTFPKRILLIDHEPHLTAVVGSALQATGRYLIRQENHSRRALHSALHFQPDLILLDAVPEHLEVDEIAQQIHADSFTAGRAGRLPNEPRIERPDWLGRLFRRLHLCRESISTRGHGELHRGDAERSRQDPPVDASLCEARTLSSQPERRSACACTAKRLQSASFHLSGRDRPANFRHAHAHFNQGCIATAPLRRRRSWCRAGCAPGVTRRISHSSS